MKSEEIQGGFELTHDFLNLWRTELEVLRPYKTLPRRRAAGWPGRRWGHVKKRYRGFRLGLRADARRKAATREFVELAQRCMRDRGSWQTTPASREMDFLAFLRKEREAK